jgi:hypothetical protein
VHFLSFFVRRIVELDQLLRPKGIHAGEFFAQKINGPNHILLPGAAMPDAGQRCRSSRKVFQQ